MKKSITITQTVVFKTTPKAVYTALLDSKKHTAFTGAKASIIKKVGGAFSAYDGYCGGYTLTLEPNKKIVQAWRSSDWPTGHYSLAEFVLQPVKQGTKLVFTQIGVPANKAKDITTGWKEFYWELMAKFFAAQ